MMARVMGDPAQRETIFGFSGVAAKIAAVAILLLSVSLLLSALPEEYGTSSGVRDLIRKLYFLPILLSASWFAARGAAAATVVATVACLGIFGGSWPADPSMQAVRMGEAGVFWLVGALSASFFEQQIKHFLEVETANENTLIALASALDMREHSTGVHSQRVADYTVRLAGEMKIRDRSLLEILWKGGLLHDVGKIGIPDSVLLKSGPLSEEEWEIMRRHPEIGCSMLRRISFLREPSEIVLCHHERFDGSGYPRGVAGKAIPLGARIFAAVDVYDALTTVRVYHGAASHAEGISALRRGAGSHFDPDVVAAFERIPYEDWAAIARKNATPPGPETAWDQTASMDPAAPSAI
jgi:putative nucleotidyltransferase with HDIG domain